MKRGILTGLVVLAALMMVSGGAWAYDQAYHVKQSPNGKGDLLIFPMYFTANGGWETKLTVYNTSTQYSVIAKVLIRSHRYTSELLDFFIYLTPTDVWTGILKYNPASDASFPNALIYSEDDSVLVDSSNFASKANPLNRPLYKGYRENCSTPTDDSGDRGYVEVIETWYGDVSQTVYPNTSALKNTVPVSKLLLKNLYAATQHPGLETTPPANGARGDGHSIDHTINTLAGFMEIQNPLVSGMTSSMRATVFADFDMASYLTLASNTGLEVANTNGQNTIGELEAAMSKHDIAMPYVNNPATGAFTVHTFNFPTKLSQINACAYINNHANSPYWFDTQVAAGNTLRDAYACQFYGATVYDLSENKNVVTDIFSGKVVQSKMCEEVNILTSIGYASLFTEGWTQYLFDYTGRTGTLAAPTTFAVKRTTPTATFSYTGVPVIPFVLMVKNGGISMMEGAYSDGLVFSGTVPVFPAYPLGGLVGTATAYPNQTLGATVNWLPNYQYFNYIDTLGIHTVAAGYPRATSAPTAGPQYWNDTVGVNLPTIPQYFPY